MVELIGVAAAIFELIALLMLGNKNILGFFSGIIGNILWVTFVIFSGGAYGLLLVSTCAFVLNIKGYLNWKRK